MITSSNKYSLIDINYMCLIWPIINILIIYNYWYVCMYLSVHIQIYMYNYIWLTFHTKTLILISQREQEEATGVICVPARVTPCGHSGVYVIYTQRVHARTHPHWGYTLSLSAGWDPGWGAAAASPLGYWVQPPQHTGHIWNSQCLQIGCLQKHPE